jgi:hypothetical protein
MTIYVRQTHLGEHLGMSFEEMDKTLIEYGLKSGELATQKAIDEDYVEIIILEGYPPIYSWNVARVSELTGKKLQIEFYVTEVRYCIENADEQPDRYFALLLASQAYNEVPVALRKEIQNRMLLEYIENSKQACEKCGRMTFKRVKGFCWRCIPDDPFIQQRIDYEAKVREKAAQLPETVWGTVYTDYNLEPKDTDIELWNSAIDTAIEAFLVRLIDPSKCDRILAKNIIHDSTRSQARTEFANSGFENHGDWGRCVAFLRLAHEIVANVLLQEANEATTRAPK